jgi:hypothetical protein
MDPELKMAIMKYMADASPGNSNQPICKCYVKPMSDARAEALVAQLNEVKQVGKTDYEAPVYKSGRLIVKPTPAWRKMVVLG